MRQFFQRLFGPIFLDGGDHADNQQGNANGNGVGSVAQDERNAGRKQQHDDEWFFHLFCQRGKDGLQKGQTVFAKEMEAFPERSLAAIWQRRLQESQRFVVIVVVVIITVQNIGSIFGS
jgi:hypothetical protein